VEEADRRLRNATYRLFVELGRAPSADELADAVAAGSVEAVVQGWRRLHEAHALVLNRATDEIRMANPFSAVPTAFRVQTPGRSWYANCAWDAFGVCAALHTNGEILSSCPDCGEQLTVEVRRRQPWPTELLFHCLVPAARWWDDIVFT
jgi:hypothetical protein